MCEILFMAKDKVFRPNDGFTDALRGHRRGDPIAVMPNGHQWGAGEDKRAYQAKYGNTDGWGGMFVVVQITDLSVAKAEKFLERGARPAAVLDPEYLAPSAADRVVETSRKAWGVDLMAIPSTIRNKLADKGYAQVTVAQIKTHFKHKLDGRQIG